MSNPNSKRVILEVRGKSAAPAQDGTMGCAKPLVERADGKFRLVLGPRARCDARSKWRFDLEHGAEARGEFTWSATGVLATDWMDIPPDTVKMSCWWELLAPPSVVVTVGNFIKAMVSASKDGFRMVSRPVMEKRLAICRACEYWSDDARLGFGKCSHPGCGCSRGKLYLKSQACPMHLWGVEEKDNVVTLDTLL